MEPTNQPNPSPYFLNTQQEPSSNVIAAKLRAFWQGFQYYARQVWPYVNRLLTFLIYNTVKVIKGIVRITLQQVGMMKD